MEVSSVHCPVARWKGPPPTMSETGEKLPGGLNSRVVPSASPHAIPSSAPRARSRIATVASADTGADLGVLVRPQQHHAQFAVERAQHEHLRLERADLAGREVDDGHDERAQQLVALVGRDLRRGAFDPDLRAEVDRELPGGLARLREVVDGHHAADPHVDLQEVVDIDLAHDDRMVRIQSEAVRSGRTAQGCVRAGVVTGVVSAGAVVVTTDVTGPVMAGDVLVPVGEVLVGEVAVGDVLVSVPVGAVVVGDVLVGEVAVPVGAVVVGVDVVPVKGLTPPLAVAVTVPVADGSVVVVAGLIPDDELVELAGAVTSAVLGVLTTGVV